MPSLRDAIADQLRTHGVSHADELARLAAPSVRIDAERTSMDALPLGASRFGGAPDLPAGFAWPERDGSPLVFLAQIDLAEASAPRLPNAGWLLFFYDAVDQPWGFDPNDRGASAVVFVDVERASLERAPHPHVDELEETFAPCRLRFAPAIDLPDAWDGVVEAADLSVGEPELDAYAEVATALSGVHEDAPYHHLLGHPQLLQNDMRGECELVTNGIYCGNPSGYESAEARALLPSAATDWHLLLQLDTDERSPGWMWGDAGRLYFWIRDEDLARSAFERAWLVLQCG